MHRISKEEIIEGIMEKLHLLWALEDDEKLFTTREQM